VEKRFEDKTPVTTVQLSENGRRTIAQYWDDLQSLHEQADTWASEEGNDTS
jgi:hypothetical protein